MESRARQKVRKFDPLQLSADRETVGETRGETREEWVGWEGGEGSRPLARSIWQVLLCLLSESQHTPLKLRPTRFCPATHTPQS